MPLYVYHMRVCMKNAEKWRLVADMPLILIALSASHPKLRLNKNVPPATNLPSTQAKQS